MSRIGKQPIELPDGVSVTVSGGNVTVKGKNGELSQSVHPDVNIAVEENVVTVTVNNPTVKAERSLWGTFTALLKNMVTGVTDGFEKKLEIQGVGYKWKVSGKKLNIEAGYSHTVDLDIPEGLEAKVDDGVLVVTGADKQQVGEFSANVRKVREPEPYKGTGIRYQDEYIARKAGKQAASAE
jgi:large subunit ribosomal protein L6